VKDLAPYLGVPLSQPRRTLKGLDEAVAESDPRDLVWGPRMKAGQKGTGKGKGPVRIP
jgi:hypothetical protein